MTFAETFAATSYPTVTAYHLIPGMVAQEFGNNIDAKQGNFMDKIVNE